MTIQVNAQTNAGVWGLRAEEDGSTLQAQRAGQLGLLGGVK